MEQMLGSYGPSPDPWTKAFDTEESPSGLLARSGTYNVKSVVLDDDGEKYAGVWDVYFLRKHSGLTWILISEWTWSFKLAKEW